MAEYPFDENEKVTLCEAIDRILNKGAVIVGEATISVADVDLIYLALQVVLSSVETAGTALKEVSPASQTEPKGR
jgi:hypothetical protein